MHVFLLLAKLAVQNLLVQSSPSENVSSSELIGGRGVSSALFGKKYVVAGRSVHLCTSTYDHPLAKQR